MMIMMMMMKIYQTLIYYDVDAIVQPLPKTYKHSRTALVNFLQQCRCVTWDECGVISIEKFGQIHMSHST